MLSLYRPLTDLFRDDFMDRPFDAFLSRTNGSRPGFSPAVDVIDAGNAYLLKAEVPGIPPESIELKVENNVLTLTGERRLENEENKEGYRRVERSYGRFSRSFTLPEGTRVDAIDARTDSGVLTVTIPKLVKAAPHTVEIKTGGIVDKAKKIFAKAEERTG